jgi:DNA repair protein RadC
MIDIVRTDIGGDRNRVTTPPELYELFQTMAAGATKESLFVVAFDGQNGIIGIDEVYKGTATGTSVRIAELFHPLVHMNAVGFALVHNHPSTNIDPSDADLQLTAEVVTAAKMMDLEFLDHLIVGDKDYTSIRSKHTSLWGD